MSPEMSEHNHGTQPTTPVSADDLRNPIPEMSEHADRTQAATPDSADDLRNPIPEMSEHDHRTQAATTDSADDLRNPILDAPDAALVAAITHADGADHVWTVEALATEVGTTPTVVEAIIREGLLRPTGTDPVTLGPGAADTLRSGMSLLDAGLPLGELLDLAGRADTALRGLAEHAVDVFLAFVRDPARADDGDGDAADHLVRAFDTMLPAAARLVGDHFRDLVLDVARDRADTHDDPGSRVQATRT